VDDIVAVEVETDGGSCFFLTWGRIQNAVDPAPLEAVIMSVANRFSLPGTPLGARVCVSLQEAREAPYFYECFFELCQRPIPFGDGYEEWRQERDERLRGGREISFAGTPPRAP
jgi:hypothetical protein